MSFWSNIASFLSSIASLGAIITVYFTYKEMKNKEKSMLQHQQEKEKAQIQLLIIDWVHGVPFSPTQNNQGLWGIRISNYSKTAFRDFYLEFQDKKGNWRFYAPYIRPGDFFWIKKNTKFITVCEQSKHLICILTLCHH